MSAAHPEYLYVAQAVEAAVLLAAVWVLGQRYREHRTAATGAALSMFSILLLIIGLGQFQITDDGSLLKHGYSVALISVLLLVPYLLVRFAHALGAVSDTWHRAALALTGVQIAWTAVLPRFPQPGEQRSVQFTGYVILVVAAWVFQALLSANGLWRSGSNQPSVVRHRMRTLGSGAVVVALALVSSAGSSQPDSVTQIISTIIGVLGICLLVLAFVVPSWLRTAWRSADLVELGSVQRLLMTALTQQDVAAMTVPAAVKLFGASSAALLGATGIPLCSRGMSSEEIATLGAHLRAVDAETTLIVVDESAFACRLDDGWLVVRAGTFAPVFGPAEFALLDRIGSFADLALQRCRLFEQEVRSRAAVEAANAELQTLVYSVSHDLRNPIISVLGYLDVLSQEHAGELQGDGERYLERISVNALYMQSLIHDLLELSRIGRSEPAPQAVSLGPLVESVITEVGAQHPGCTLRQVGPFPVLWMSELRARQLLTNLIDNAAKHAQGDAVVEVQATTRPEGGAVLLISDNGKGIAPHYREKAFEVFERLDAARSDVPGTGMGLPICKRIVETLGGTISLEGPPPTSSTGTTVRMVLPPASVLEWAEPLPQKENAS